MLSTGRRAALKNGRIGQYQTLYNHGDRRSPRHHIERGGVHVLAHQVASIYQQQDEDNHYRKPKAIAHLRENQDFPQWRVRQQHDTGAHYDQDRVQPVKNRRLFEFVVDSRLKAQSFADHMRGGERQDRGREKRSVQQTEGKQDARATPGQGNQRLRRLRSIGDVAMAGGIQGRRGANDDEEHNHHATHAAEQHIRARLRILTRADFFLHETGLQIEKLPRSDGGPNQPHQHDQIAGFKLDVRNDGVTRSLQPIRMCKNRREQIRKIQNAREQKNHLNLAIRSLQYKRPDQRSGDGHRDVLAHAKNLHGRRHASKFRNQVGQVHEKAGDHHKERRPESEFLANQI